MSDGYLCTRCWNYYAVPGEHVIAFVRHHERTCPDNHRLASLGKALAAAGLLAAADDPGLDVDPHVGDTARYLRGLASRLVGHFRVDETPRPGYSGLT